MWFNWKLRRTCSHWKRRSRPCMALGKWIQQWLQIVAEIATEHPNVVTRLLWPCTRCFVDNRTQSHSTPPYKGAWANATKSATTQSSPTPTHPAHNPHPRPAWGDVHSPERSFSRESFATRAPPSRARQQSSPASHPLRTCFLFQLGRSTIHTWHRHGHLPHSPKKSRQPHPPGHPEGPHLDGPQSSSSSDRRGTSDRRGRPS